MWENGCGMDTTKYYISQVNNNQPTSDICQITYLDISCLFTVVIVDFYLHSCCYAVILQFSCLSCYLVYLVIILCTLFICTSSPLYTHSPGRFLTTLNLYVQILDALFLLFRCSMRPYASRRAGASLYLIPIFLSFVFLLFPDSRYIRFSRYSIS